MKKLKNKNEIQSNQRSLSINSFEQSQNFIFQQRENELLHKKQNIDAREREFKNQIEIQENDLKERKRNLHKIEIENNQKQIQLNEKIQEIKLKELNLNEKIKNYERKEIQLKQQTELITKNATQIISNNNDDEND